MSLAIGSDRSRLRSKSGFARAGVFIVEWPPDILDGLAAIPFDGRESDAFDRLERRINDG
jgi:hypothetical protein